MTGQSQEDYESQLETKLEALVKALKVTKPSQAQAPHDPKREARILAVARHASVIPLLSTFSISDGHFVLTFPFARLDLAALLDAPEKVRKNTSFQNQLRNHLHSLFSALAHIHSLGIIHRDIKPSNILLEEPTGPAYLADFGIAWLPGDPSSEQADKKITDVGTTCYRPPELLFGNKAYGTSLDLDVGYAKRYNMACMFLQIAVASLSNSLIIESTGSAKLSRLGQIRVQALPSKALD